MMPSSYHTELFTTAQGAGQFIPGTYYLNQLPGALIGFSVFNLIFYFFLIWALLKGNPCSSKGVVRDIDHMCVAIFALLFVAMYFIGCLLTLLERSNAQVMCSYAWGNCIESGTEVTAGQCERTEPLFTRACNDVLERDLALGILAVFGTLGNLIVLIHACLTDARKHTSYVNVNQ